VWVASRDSPAGATYLVATYNTATAASTASAAAAAARYGDEKHLDEALDKIWKFGRQGNPPKKMCPTLTGLREEVVDVSGLAAAAAAAVSPLCCWICLLICLLMVRRAVGVSV
jgi:hypothetical protein